MKNTIWRRKKLRTRFRGTCSYGALQDIILLNYIQCLWCDITGPRNKTQFTSFSLLCLIFENPLNKLAKFTRDKTPPNWDAKMACQNNLPKSTATPTHRIFLARIRCDSSSQYWLAGETPLPRSGFPGKTRPAMSPPPPPPPELTRRKGEGVENWPGPPVHPKQVLSLSFPLHSQFTCSIWYNNISISAQSGLISKSITMYRSCGTFFILREASTAERRYKKERWSENYMHMAAFSTRWVQKQMPQIY